MPESEIFKMVLQGGMLGLWILVIWWVMTRGVPILKEQIDRLIASHEVTVLQISAENRANITDINAANKESAKVIRDGVETLGNAHRDAVTTLAKECRDERKEIMNVLYTTLNVDPVKVAKA